MSDFRRFLSYYRPYKWLFAADLFSMMMVCGISLAFPQILNLLTKNLFLKDGATILHWLPWVFAGLAALYALRYLCFYFVTSWGHIMGARMESDMRHDLFRQYQKLSFSYYDANNTGEMMSKLTTDLFDVTELAHHGPEVLLNAGLTIIGSFVVLMTLNLPMTLILYAVTALMAVYCIRMNVKMRRTFTDNRRKIAKVNARIQDSLAGIRVVKSFANENLEERKFDNCNKAFLVSKTRNYKIMGEFHGGLMLMRAALHIIILVGGGYFVARGRLDPHELAIFALYITMFGGQVGAIINFNEQFQRGWTGIIRFCDVLKTMPDIKDSPGARDLPADIRGEVEFKGVSFQYLDKQPVLHDVSFRIPAGHTVALAGESGGGKSTICSLLPRFYDVTSGSVTIDGIDVRDLKLQDLRRHIGIVQQEVYLFGSNIRENIMYGNPGATEAQMIEAAKKANIHDFVMSLPDGYDTKVGERGTRLSGG
ncbi:MAG: ABC transporter ATP-binding protein, partial [Lentisphaeria bacterium]|nr:ABC transporter ATP-binding protein [Lentisphaeria bacterium]